MYNSVGSSVLAAIIKKKTGLGLHEYLKPRLYDKIGILSDNHRWIKMPDGTEMGGGGLFSTTEDNLRLMKLYANGGVWDNERILAEDYVKRATSLQNESATEAIGNPEARDNFVGYGYQIWMCQPKRRIPCRWRDGTVHDCCSGSGYADCHHGKCSRCTLGTGNTGCYVGIS